MEVSLLKQSIVWKGEKSGERDRVALHAEDDKERGAMITDW